MVEVMTDKATVTITAPKGGTVVETRGKVGEIVKVHGVHGRLRARRRAPRRRVAANGGHQRAHEKDDGPAATAVGDIKESLPGMGARPPLRPQSAASASAGASRRATSTTSPSRRPRRASSRAT